MAAMADPKASESKGRLAGVCGLADYRMSAYQRPTEAGRWRERYSNLRLFGNFQGVIALDAEISHRTFQPMSCRT